MVKLALLAGGAILLAVGGYVVIDEIRKRIERARQNTSGVIDGAESEQHQPSSGTSS